MTAEGLIRTYLDEARLLQLATVRDGQPWASTVNFVADDDLNFYWVSVLTRRHSQEIADHAKVAAAIAVQANPSVGIQVEGEAERLTDVANLRKAAELYHQRYQHDLDFVQDFVADRRQHKFYRLKPRLIVLFDEKTFPQNPRKEWRPASKGVDTTVIPRHNKMQEEA